MDLTTLFVEQVIIHRVPKVKLEDKGDHAPWTAVVTKTPAVSTDTITEAALTLRAVVPELTVLTTGERSLLGEWLHRMTAS
jgi:hypothetical protein